MMVTNSESFESRVRLVKQNSRHLLTVPLFSESTQHPIVDQTGQSWPVQRVRESEVRFVGAVNASGNVKFLPAV